MQRTISMYCRVYVLAARQGCGGTMPTPLIVHEN
jgi:hypothetical protein